jgi:hypothetical protein
LYLYNNIPQKKKLTRKMDPRFYEEMGGFQSTFSEMSQLYFGPVYTSEVVTMTPMLQPAYNPTCNAVGMGFDLKTNSPALAASEHDGKINLQVENQVLSRLQWYNLNIKFVDGAGHPILANHVAEYDEQNKFYDGRRTYLGVDSNSKKEKKVFLQLAAVCHQTGKSLRKCSVCVDKDKTVIQKKRKGNNVWNDQDEFNNKRVIQILPSETNRIDENGELRIRFRVACCIGVNKHPHHNHHCPEKDNSDGPALELHNGCYGLNLTLTALFQKENGSTASVHSANSVGPIRVLSKGEKANRVPASRKRKLDHNSDSTNEDDYDLDENTDSPTTSGEYSPRGPPVKKERRLSPNVDFLVKVLPNTYEYDSMFHKFAVVQRDYIERYFPSPFTAVYRREFWGGLDLDPQSPQMLEVLTTLTIGACISGYGDEAKKFSTLAYECANGLLQSRPSLNRSDSLLLADGLNRFAFCCGAKSSIGKARFYNAYSYQLFEQLIQAKADVGEDATIEKRAYETCLWVYIVCNMNNLSSCQKICKWASANGGHELQAFSYFITMMSAMVPELLNYREHLKHLATTRESSLLEGGLEHVMPSMLSTENKGLIFYYYDMLKATFTAANYADLVEPGYTKPYKRLIEESFLALDHWLLGNELQASQHAQEASVQAAVFDKPGLPALIAIFIAAFVNLQLTRRDLKHADRVELLMRTFVRNPCWKWLKILVDFMVSILELMLGQPLNITYKHHVGLSAGL